MKVSKYFNLEEMVPKAIFKQFGSQAAWFINPRLLDVLDALRQETGARIIVNNWSSGGTMELRGYRPPDCTLGAKYSMHKLGLAVDISSPDISLECLRKELFFNQSRYIALGLTTLEDEKFTPTWIHLDCRPLCGSMPAKGYFIVKPAVEEISNRLIYPI
jgi:hypothetical protein